jgi:pyrroline-5-carboxylate reductase
MKVTLIGGGNMGSAIVSAIISKRVSRAEYITVSDKDETKLAELEEKYGINVTSDNVAAITDADVVILAIKPQNLAEEMSKLNGKFKPRQLVLSIIAGAKIHTLWMGFGHKAIVRTMPNTPAQIGEGMTVWTATPEVTEKQKTWAQRILGVMGKEIYVDDEKYLDAVTAVSGSGPAYFFLFIEAMVDAAQNIGLDREIAQELVVQTMLGSGHFLQQSGKTPAELRKMVTSPGGTTAAAIAQFEKGNFNELVKTAVAAAYKRSIELGKA